MTARAAATSSSCRAAPWFPPRPTFLHAGAATGAGQSKLTFAAGSETVQFLNLVAVTDTVNMVAPNTLTVNGTSGNDSIVYTQGSVAANGMVAVNNLVPIEFSNKPTLVLNGGTGADTFTLNNASATAPTGLTGITVAGDPNPGTVAGNDTLVLSGRNSATDAFIVRPTALGVGTVADAGSTTVTYGDIAAMQIVGQTLDGDSLDVEGTAGNDLFVYTPGTTGDSGTVGGTLNAPTLAFAMPAITFSGLTGKAALGGVNFQSVAASGVRDTLIYNGTPADNKITLSGTTPVTLANMVGGQAFSTVVATGMALPGSRVPGIVIDLNAGPNLVTVPGGVAPAVTVQGNGPAANSTLTFNPTAGVASTLDFNAQTITSNAGSTVVTFKAVGTVNVNGGGNLTVNGTGGSQNVTYTPTGTQAGTVVAAATGPTVNVSAMTGTFTIDPGAVAAGNAANSVTVNGTAGNDTITVVNNAGGLPTVQVNTMLRAVIKLDGPGDGRGPVGHQRRRRQRQAGGRQQRRPGDRSHQLQRPGRRQRFVDPARQRRLYRHQRHLHARRVGRLRHQRAEVRRRHRVRRVQQPGPRARHGPGRRADRDRHLGQRRHQLHPGRRRRQRIRGGQQPRARSSSATRPC